MSSSFQALLEKAMGEGISHFFFFKVWKEVGHWERGGTLIVGKESEGADRPGRKGICSGITHFFEATGLGQKGMALF